jgi:hypothetical protein
MVFISRVLITPVVSVRERPNGLPMASTLCPSCKLPDLPTGIGWMVERGCSQSDDCQVVIGRTIDTGGVDGFTAVEAHLDKTGTLDDMEIGYHTSAVLPKKAGTGSLTKFTRIEESGQRIVSEYLNH